MVDIKMEITGLKRCHAERKEGRKEGEEEVEELQEDRQALLLDGAMREGE